MYDRRARYGLLLASVLACAAGPMPLAAEPRGGEVGALLGGVLPDKDLAEESSPSPEVVLGLRGGAVFSPHWTWFVDGLYESIGTTGALGEARSVFGRSGVDYLFGQGERRWFVTGALGWMVVDYENGTLEDFHRPLVSAGGGQRFDLSGRWQLRWEVRGDQTLDDPGVGGAGIFHVYALAGLIFGPAGRTRASDSDVDGVSDRRDRCPDTPAGARVDTQGCPADADADGVADPVDRCPNTRSGMPTGPDGCPRDSDADGVPDASDACPGTPGGVTADEWGCPRDSDADGVPDGLDRCPDTVRGARVNPDGCPRDGDGDGVSDGLDRCPETPRGSPVNAVGCPRG